MVTIRDVAREAGVSVATVSRVCNGSPRVALPTRLRVEAVAARLGYSPNPAARTLATSRTQTLGALLPDLYGEFFSELIRGIDHAARRAGYHLLVASSRSRRSDVVAALRALAGRVDGLLVMQPELDGRAIRTSLPDRFPVVLLNSRSGRAFDSLSVTNFEGAFAMVRHLVSMGHERIALIGGTPRNHDVAERRRGYRAALRSSGISLRSTLEVPGDFTEGSGYRAALRLAARRPRPTAIFAANDAMAIGALSALRERGVRVPEDIAVAGFDDIPLARYTSPPLTTVAVNVHRLGARATECLIDSLANRRSGPRRTEALPATLVVRGTCGGRDPAPATSSVPPSPPTAPESTPRRRHT